MLLPTLLFGLFALLSGAGVFLMLTHHRNRASGALGAFLTLAFFAALYAGLLALFREGGL
jgi:ABC-type multidrug transport system permease subunit